MDALWVGAAAFMVVMVAFGVWSHLQGVDLAELLDPTRAPKLDVTKAARADAVAARIWLSNELAAATHLFQAGDAPAVTAAAATGPANSGAFPMDPIKTIEDFVGRVTAGVEKFDAMVQAKIDAAVAAATADLTKGFQAELAKLQAVIEAFEAKFPVEEKGGAEQGETATGEAAAAGDAASQTEVTG